MLPLQLLLSRLMAQYQSPASSAQIRIVSSYPADIKISSPSPHCPCDGANCIHFTSPSDPFKTAMHSNSFASEPPMDPSSHVSQIQTLSPPVSPPEREHVRYHIITRDVQKQLCKNNLRFVSPTSGQQGSRPIPYHILDFMIVSFELRRTFPKVGFL